MTNVKNKNNDFRRNKDYLELKGYFKPILGQDAYFSRSVADLIKNGFRLEHWKPFCFLIENDLFLPFDMVVSKLLGRTIDNHALYALLYLGVRIIPEKIKQYLKVQVRECYKNEFLFRGKALDIYLGFKSGNTEVSDLLYSKSARTTPIKNMIREIIEEYWETNDNILKARCRSYVVDVKYQGKKISIQYSQGSKNEERVYVNSFEKLRNLIEDAASDRLTIKEMQKFHNGPISERHIFLARSTFNLKKLLHEIKYAYWQLIKLNQPIRNINQAIKEIVNFEAYQYKKADTAKTNLILKAITPETLQKLKEIDEHMIKVQKRIYKQVNKIRLKNKEKVAVCTYLDNEKVLFVSSELMFTHLPLYSEWAEYENSREPSRYRQLFLPEFFNYIAKKYPNKKSIYTAKITKDDLREYLESINNSKAKRVLSALRNFLTFLKNIKERAPKKMMGILPPAPTIDITEGFSVKTEYESGYQPMPDEIYGKLMHHVEELEPIYKNALILTSATGMRPGEWKGITPESMIIENGIHQIIIWQFKQEKNFGKLGKKPIRKVPITDPFVIEAFNSQVKESKELRMKSGLESIFTVKVSDSNTDSRIGILESKKMIRKVNSLIKKYNMCDINGNLWKYHTYQLRVSMVVEMIEAGSTSEELKAFFGWINEQTMQQAYVMVKNLKKVDLETNFFLDNFGVQLDQSSIDQYSEEELQMMVAEFICHSRDMGYGRCLRHPVQGECGKLHEASACAPCEKLIVGKENRPYWERLYVNQCLKLIKLRKYYEERDVLPERFEALAFYIKESGILDSYASVLMNIDKPIKVVKWHE